MSYEALISQLTGISKLSQKGLTLAASSLLADIQERVHERGRDTDGGEIKNITRKDPGTGYSKRPYFADINALPNKSNAPSASKGGFIQTPKGYESFRAFAGRQTNFVDLDLTSSLRNSMVFEVDEDTIRIGFIGGGESTQGGATAIEKAKFAEIRNGAPIFQASQKEIDEALAVYIETVLR